MKTLPQLFERLLGSVFPRVCEICGKEEAGPELSFVCKRCREHPNAIRRVRPPFCKVCGLEYEGAITMDFICANCSELELDFECAQAAVHFKGLTKEVIHRYKYQRQEWFEPFLAELLIDAALPELKHHSVNLITPIPLHAAKRHQRGFNQSERLSERLAAAAKLPHVPNLLTRVRPTESQANLDRKKRQENVKGAFAYAAKGKLNGRRILLIDDVLTTGVTASACARELRKNGAGEVRVWTVARGGLT